MMTIEPSPDAYRREARRLRAETERTEYASIRHALLEIAREYERLARTREWLAR